MEREPVPELQRQRPRSAAATRFPEGLDADAVRRRCRCPLIAVPVSGPVEAHLDKAAFADLEKDFRLTGVEDRLDIGRDLAGHLDPALLDESTGLGIRRRKPNPNNDLRQRDRVSSNLERAFGDLFRQISPGKPLWPEFRNFCLGCRLILLTCYMLQI